MKNLWNESVAAKCRGDLLKLRVYTSRLLGENADLVLHGGGNTSVKLEERDLFGDARKLLYVKGSGWDLKTIEPEGFASVKLDVLKRMAELDRLSDMDMVKEQRSAMTNPFAPNPSVEAILHAIIPFKFVEHTHADAVVTITNTPDWKTRIKEIYGAHVIIVPYVMPGFILAKTIYEMTKDTDWAKCEGMILLNHGVFTFDDDPKKSYEKMIMMVTQAEDYLVGETGPDALVGIPIEDSSDRRDRSLVGTRHGVSGPLSDEDHLNIARMRHAVSELKGSAMFARFIDESSQKYFSGLSDVPSLATRGPLTPDHVIRTKRTAAIIDKDVVKSMKNFAKNYQDYFEKNTGGTLTCLDKAPRWAVWLKKGILVFGCTVKEMNIVKDITEHTIKAIQQAENLGRWDALPEKDIFEIEYWELEQAKLKKGENVPVLQGKVAVVTGAASGIGRACVERLYAQGASVVALDINSDVTGIFMKKGILGLVCDVTDVTQIKNCIQKGVRMFGGIDILVSNAGIFPVGGEIVDMDAEIWERSIDINLSSHQRFLQVCIPYLFLGIDAAIVIVASKNVPAPGPGASAYSVAKAGLTQLARVAALELGGSGIRVNVVHPNQIFDTAIWTSRVLESRARHYGMSVEEYKTNNILKVEITSLDVADLVCVMAGPVFAKTTGAQIPIDGGNERVI